MNQQELSFQKPSQHSIAAKVVDNDGLENVEFIRLKVNGVLERN